ncbi:MAG TPA: ABC transporter substrate-binding protein [Casimicrobiaceae bacterium]|nr:ABC transporter substrate-binding protein [Casimicrobiaceae bacterium]
MRRIISTVIVVALACLGSSLPALAAGTIKIAVPSNLNTLDPAKTKIGEEYIVNFLVFSGLTEIGPDGHVKPDIAERWTSSDDLKTWTFYLRKGVKFHDGREVDAQDVIETVKRIQDKATGSVTRVNFELIDGMEAVDPHTVRFHLKAPYAGLADIFSDRQARIVPRDHLDTLAKAPIGSGPFKVKAFVPGDRVELEKFPDYYVKGVPVLDHVIMRIMPESAAQAAALESGEVDLVWNLPLESIDQFKKNPNIVIDSVPTSTWDGIIMNGAHKPFDNPKVRHAVELAIDKKQMVEVALFGYGTPTHTMIPPGHPYYNNDIKNDKPDIAKAKKLLAEAGYPDGFSVTMFTPVGRPTRERIGLATREMLKPLNIKVDIQRVPWDKFIGEVEGKQGFYVDGFYSRPTIDASIYPWYHSTGSWNTTLWNYKNADMDKLLEGARAARTEAEQKSFYVKFQQLALEDPPGVIPYVINHMNAYRKNVKNFHSSPMMWLDLRRVSVQ